MPGPHDLGPAAAKDSPHVFMQDKHGYPILDTLPVDHALLIREELSFNAQKDLVQYDRIYKTSETDPTPVIYRKRIVPGNSNETIQSTVIVYPWVKV